MPAPLVVPTIFTAVDRLSGVVQRMQRSVGGFAGKASIGINALNNGLNRLVPSFGGLGKQLFGFARAYAAFGSIQFAGEALVEYEKNAAHLHTILSDLNDSQFNKFQDQIKRTAWVTKKSATDVAAAYANIAELNPALAQTPQMLDRVARSSILLSKASRIPLDEAAQKLVIIMTQFRLGANEADRIVNSLAAGNKFGAAPIGEAADALTKFASVARRANMTLEQSNALVQVLAGAGIQGEEAGTAIKSAIVHLQRVQGAYNPDGSFNLGAAMSKVLDFYNKQKTEYGKNTFLEKLFGLHQIARAGELVASLEKINDLVPKLTGTSEAEKQAAIQTETLANRWAELKNRFDAWLNSSDGANQNMERVKSVLVYVADNIDRLVGYVITAVKWFIRLKVAIWSVQIAIGAYNIAMGIMGAVTGVANIAIGESRIALLAYRATLLLTGQTSLVFGSAMTATTAATTTATAGFTAANTAAAGLFATLSSFVVPAGLVALGGLSIWKMLEGNEKFRANEKKLLAKEFFNTKTKTGLISPFSNKQQEAAYQDWFVKGAKAGIPMDSLQRNVFDRQHGKEYNKELRSLDSVLKNNAQNQSKDRVDIFIHGDAGNIKEIKNTPGVNINTGSSIPVRTTRTTGPGTK